MSAGLYTEGFEYFWLAWPRKVAKETAIKRWSKIHPDDALLEKILRAVETQKKHVWKQLIETKEYDKIPHPASWLNAKRWDDEIVTKTHDKTPQKKFATPVGFSRWDLLGVKNHAEYLRSHAWSKDELLWDIRDKPKRYQEVIRIMGKFTHHMPAWIRQAVIDSQEPDLTGIIET